MRKPVRLYVLIIALTLMAGLISLPPPAIYKLPFINREITLGSPRFTMNRADGPKIVEFSFKKGLDIQGGMQIVLNADMSGIAEADRATALESARQVILRRVDLYGIAEPVVQTSVGNGQYRLIVELPGVKDPEKALELVGQTAQLNFMLVDDTTLATDSANLQPQIEPTELDGSKLKRASLQFDQKTGKPVVGIEFTPEGKDLFGKITEANVGRLLAIVLDGNLVMMPRINEPIYAGQAVITGSFTVEQARQLGIQLNAGALPVPIEVLEQRTVGASLGTESVTKSVVAGLIGLAAVVVFMIALYGWMGVLASFALAIYAVLTIAIYKIIGVTVTVPGIAGLILSVGMAVDANILIFERMKEELRLGKPFERAMELGFGRAWDSIKDANVTTIITALVLINPLNLSFLNSSGLVRGFGITLLIGVVLGLFTGIVVTRTLLRMFLQPPKKIT